MFLQKVLREKKKIVSEWKSKQPLTELKKNISGISKRPFYQTFSGRFIRDVRIIAEFKKASPSKEMISETADVSSKVREYEEGGAKAVSIITEETYFKGSLSFLPKAREACSLPVLRKDFIVDEYELYQSKACGADAVLLIGEALEKNQIRDYLDIAKGIDIDVLLEIHSLRSFEKAGDLKGYILGINNRNLETLTVDLTTSEKIIKSIDRERPVIVESGIEHPEEIERFMKMGVSGFLIGSSLMGSGDPVKKLTELRNIKL